MLAHFLRMFYRNFKRYKSYSFINLFGLSVGLASALLIYLWVHDELNMDKFDEKDSERHVQVLQSYPISTGIETVESTPGPLTEALGKELSEVDYAVSVITPRSFYEGILSTGDHHVRATTLFAGEGYFNIFRCDFIEGDKSQALSAKNKVVISEKMALGLFQSTRDVVGKTVSFKNQYFDGPYIVSGVFDSRSNASVKFDVMFTYERFLEGRPNLRKWNNGGTRAHLVLKEGVDPDQFNGKVKNFLDTKLERNTMTLYAQPYSERYLYGQYENGVPVGGRIIYVRLFSIIALFVLAIACINYMNLSTAKASRRIKEIGVKKAIGAKRGTLVFQYFSESLLMVFFALLIAIVFVVLLLPQFNQITGKQMALTPDPTITLSALGITVFTGLISGIYPALHLSGFNPVVALKGKLKTGLSGLWIRKGLVVFQFTISVILIVSVMVIYKQIAFIQTANLGYNKDHIISFSKEGKLESDFETFLSEVRKAPGVTHASNMHGTLPGNIGYGDGYQWKNMDDEGRRVRFYHITGGYDLVDLLGIEMKEGRSFSRDFTTDKDAIILNEAAIELIAYENPVGQRFYNDKMSEIVGVVKNFHFESLQEKIKPFFFTLSDRGDHFVVKMQAGTERETVNRIGGLYSEFNPGYPFDYKFLDDNYQALYSSEERVATLSKYFAAIAIAISCLGLLALTAFSIQRRFKEIAIRKVLGSSRLKIIGLLSREFILLVFIAIVIALPIGYYLMKNWLDDFAYRINLSPLYLMLAGLLMLLIAWLTIALQTVRSARVNVTESLRENG